MLKNFLLSLTLLFAGLGGIGNYKLTAVGPKFVIGSRIGLNLWELNKSN